LPVIGALQRLFLFGRAAQAKIVQRIFIALKSNDLEGVRNAGITCLRLTLFPVSGIDDLLEARDDERLKVCAHLDNTIPAVTSIVAIIANDSLGGAPRTSETVDDVVFPTGCLRNKLSNKLRTFWRQE
jgi:hypothetical protein